MTDVTVGRRHFAHDAVLRAVLRMEAPTTPTRGGFPDRELMVAGLRLDVVAEGVESEEQAAILDHRRSNGAFVETGWPFTVR